MRNSFLHFVQGYSRTVWCPVTGGPLDDIANHQFPEASLAGDRANPYLHPTSRNPRRKAGRHSEVFSRFLAEIGNPAVSYA
jgi:hypothetical protein